MAATTLSTTPLVHPSAEVRGCGLGAYCEVGARTQLLEVELGDYSYIVNDSDVAYATIGKFCSIAAMTRINPGNHPMERASQSHFSYRASAYFAGAANEAAFFAWRSTSLHLAPVPGVISAIGSDAPASRRIDADGLVLLPGIVDIHGDAFERQMMPRPGVGFAMDIALLDSDRQAVANGITTVFHGVTWSWEPGLRGPENARSMLAALERLRPRLGADTRFHLRHETFNLEAEPEILQWLSERRIDLVAFNDHMLIADETSSRSKKLATMVERSGLSREAFLHLVERVKARGNEVPGSIERIAQTALAHGVPLLSHDDTSPDQRRWFRALGCRLAEFPTTLETAQEAASQGDDIVLGAPNVVRGGSHIGWIDAKEMVGRGLCSVLASDYYYPAQLLAAFRLVDENVLPLHAAWALVSQTAAVAARLTDRGTIASGRRADLILVDTRHERPRVVATIVAGRIVHLVDANRITAC